MPELFEVVNWNWKAFLEGKLPKHLDEVQRLESAVSDTVAKHAHAANELVGKLTSAMLAAVATLVGSIAIAAFSRPLNVALLKLGIYAYSVYMAVFPGVIGLLSSWRQFTLANQEFDVRRRRFEEILPKSRVDEIVGRRIRRAKVEYWLWWIGVAFIYAIVVTAGLMAAKYAPLLFVS